MKRSLFILMSMVFVLASCSKYEVSDTVTADMLGKATISGVAYVDVDKTNSGMEFVPSGTTLLFFTNYSNLLTGATGVYSLTTTVGANGAYSIAFPAKESGTTITITGAQLVLDVKENSATKSQIFKMDNAVTVRPNMSFVKDLIYSKDADRLSIADWQDATLEFSLKYINSSATLTPVDVPSGTPIRLTYKNINNENVFVETTVKADGKVTFTIKAPSVIDGGKSVTVSTTALLSYTVGTTTTKRTFSYSSTITVYGGVTITLPANQQMTGPF